MAQRMISDLVFGMDDFIEMPFSAQALYAQLVLQADNAGFLTSINKTVRAIGATQDDVAELERRGFILRFSGTPTCCIRHWHLMNKMRNGAKSQVPEYRLVRKNGGVYEPIGESEEDDEDLF